MAKPIKIVVTGGGTAGHLLPIVAVTRELRRLYQGDELVMHYIGPNDHHDLLSLRHENVIIHRIFSGKLRRYLSFKNIIDILFNIPISFIQSFFLLAFIDPRIVFSKGGTGSLPVTWCARILGIPVFIHESDMVPGLSNRISSKWAKKIFISFAKTGYFDLQKTILVGNPIQKELLEGDENKATELFNLRGDKPLIMIFGGSQGASALNDFVILAINELLQKYEVLHICGKKNFKSVQEEMSVVLKQDFAQYYHIYDSLDEIHMKHAYKAATLIISRAGSASIFEIAALGKPSILVPLPGSAGDHQAKNAYDYANTGAALLLEQQNITPHFFMSKIDSLISQPQKLEAMSQAALSFAKPLAAKAIAREILEYLGPIYV